MNIFLIGQLEYPQTMSYIHEPINIIASKNVIADVNALVDDISRVSAYIPPKISNVSQFGNKD